MFICAPDSGQKRTAPAQIAERLAFRPKVRHTLASVQRTPSGPSDLNTSPSVADAELSNGSFTKIAPTGAKRSAESRIL
jgi:hypothetical protein